MSLFGRLVGRRQPRWDEQWETYPGTVEDEPGLWSVDLGAVAAAPVADLPFRLDVHVTYRANPAGLPLERPPLDEIADALRGIAAGLGGAYIGFVARRGSCRFISHLPAAPDAPVVVPGRADAGVGSEYDPHWAFVRDTLAPDDRQHQHLADLSFVRYLIDNGDVLATPRDVEHVAVFPEQVSADDAAIDLREAGFDVTVERDDEGEYAVTALRTDPVQPPAVHELSWSVREVVERHGGGYGGWHCAPVG